MKTMQVPRWTATPLSVVAVLVLLAGIVAALTLQAPRTVTASDRLQLVGNAASAAAAAGSYRMEMDFQLEGAGMQFEVTGSAQVTESGEGKGEVTLPNGQQLQFLATENRGWFQLPESSPMRLGGKEWVSFPVERGQAGLTEDPLDFLALLSDDGQVLDMGEQEVRGVQTRQYRAELDPQALSDMAQEQQGTQQGSLISPQVFTLMEEGRTDVWLDDEGLPRRVQVVVAAQGMQGTFSFDLFEFGEPVTVTPPAAEDVIDVETQGEATGLLTGQ